MTPNRLCRPLDDLLSEVDGDWQPVIDAWRATDEARRLIAHVDARVAAGAAVYPANPVRMLQLTPLHSVRVVIVGQDPYHGPGQAQGLAFSVPEGVRLPPSLRNIFKELHRDLGLPMPASGDLTPWARRGVLLTNTSLTVEDGQAGCHAGKGWESLTRALLTAVAQEPRPKVFMLWGNHAQAFGEPIAAAHPQHLVLASNHPSPLSAQRPPVPFIGCGHFGRAQEFLASQENFGSMDWTLQKAVL
ncbi:uracil-DNA glycosylase [uncultured Aquincola sp.]|uniref:uracil-DNA glycosylase n=1 Tax=uncultured Aquincola sp. TaxID=886556 RepID=UPI0032B0F3CD